jgi:hypothetical protein
MEDRAFGLKGWAWWYTFIIPATQDVEMGGLRLSPSPPQKVSEILSQNYKKLGRY